VCACVRACVCLSYAGCVPNDIRWKSCTCLKRLPWRFLSYHFPNNAFCLVFFVCFLGFIYVVVELLVAQIVLGWTSSSEIVLEWTEFVRKRVSPKTTSYENELVRNCSGVDRVRPKTSSSEKRVHPKTTSSEIVLEWTEFVRNCSGVDRVRPKLFWSGPSSSENASTWLFKPPRFTRPEFLLVCVCVCVCVCLCHKSTIEGGWWGGE